MSDHLEEYIADCPHAACHKSMRTEMLVQFLSDNTTGPRLVLRHGFCTACKDPIVLLTRESGFPGQTKLDDRVLYPSRQVRPVPPEVTGTLRDDFREACATLNVSAKASATLSRLCLQAILSGQGYGQRDLVDQITALLGEEDPKKQLPSTLHETIDAIRNFGNFGAHPITDEATLQIVDVDPHEAEFCLEIVEELFDHYYVKPANNARKMAKLNKKLAAAGKPTAKGATTQPVTTAPPQKPSG